MERWRLFAIGLTVLAGALLLATSAHAQVSGGKEVGETGWMTHSQHGLFHQWLMEVTGLTHRGIATSSPVDSPDAYAPSVGGKVKAVPYYQGYWGRSRRSYWGAFLPSTGAVAGGLGGAQLGRGAPANYGSYSGARKDEANLLRLGGFEPSGNQLGGPKHGRPTDLIDLIENKGKTKDGPRYKAYSLLDDRELGNGLVPSTGSLGLSR